MFFVVRHKPTDRRPKKKQRKLAASMGVPFPRDVQCSDAEKCMRLSKLQRGVTSPSKDHCTDKFGSKYGGTNVGPVAVDVVSRCRWRKRGVSSAVAVSPLQEAQLALRRVQQPLGGSEKILYPHTKLKGTGRPWKIPMDFKRVVDEYILLNLVVVLEFWSINSMYGIFTYSCFIFYGTCMQM